MTTDTTEAPSAAMKRSGLEDSEASPTSKSEGKTRAGASEAEEEIEGILSSDEESTTAPQAKSPSGKIVGDKPLQSQQEEIKSFASADGKEKAKPIFESLRAQEEMENKYSFGENDVEEFSAKLQTKQERESSKGTINSDNAARTYVLSKNINRDF